MIKNWVKKLLVLCLACVLTFGVFVNQNVAKAVHTIGTNSVNQVTANIGEQKIGIVTCTNVSIRTAPDTRASRYTRLENGSNVLILGEWDKDWYIIDLKFIGQGEGQGYALKE